MKSAYLDSSVLLRWILGERDALTALEIGHLISSELIRVETLRTIDRLRKQGTLDDSEIVEKNSHVLELLKRVELIPISKRVLDQAASPFSIALGTLDAIHLSSAILWQQSENQTLLMLTHDFKLANASRALGFEVLGV